MRVLFMGTPEIAVAPLRALHAEYGVAAVFCQPDRPVGRKQVLTAPAVKQCALELGIPCFQPQSLKTQESLELYEQLSPDLTVVMAYGKILPQRMLELPRYGCINLHASLLPKWRGSAPIQRAIAAGDTQTGVTVMHMDAGIDTGDIISLHPLNILPQDNAQTVSDAISALAASCIVPAVHELVAGTAARIKQDDSLSCYAPMLKKEDGRFTFQMPAQTVCNMVRAYCVWPCASFQFGDKSVKLLRAQFDSRFATPGQVLSINPLTVAAQGGSVVLDTVVPQGQREMSGAQWAAGLRLRVGDFLESGEEV